MRDNGTVPFQFLCSCPVVYGKKLKSIRLLISA